MGKVFVGGKNMRGKNKGLVALVSKVVENAGSKPLVLRCINSPCAENGCLYLMF